MKEVYLVNCCRTAVGKFQGSLSKVPAPTLGGIVIKEALKRAGIAPEQVDEVMFGNILTAGLGQNPARQAALNAGIPYSVPAYTVGMVCGSGMKSVIEGARAILAGEADVIVAGGQENMTAALLRPHRPGRRPDVQHQHGGHHGQRRPVGRLPRLSHGHHR